MAGCFFSLDPRLESELTGPKVKQPFLPRWEKILFSPNDITQHSKGLFPPCQIGNKSKGVDFRNEGEQEQSDPVFEVSVGNVQ